MREILEHPLNLNSFRIVIMFFLGYNFLVFSLFIPKLLKSLLCVFITSRTHGHRFNFCKITSFMVHALTVFVSILQLFEALSTEQPGSIHLPSPKDVDPLHVPGGPSPHHVDLPPPKFLGSRVRHDGHIADSVGLVVPGLAQAQVEEGGLGDRHPCGGVEERCNRASSCHC